MNSMFEKYAEIIRNLPHRKDSAVPPRELTLWENKSMKLECFYAPFEYVNTKARIILVGITPGRTQMNRAINAARLAIICGDDVHESIRKVKREGSFSGTLRPNIVNILNRLGYQETLKLDCLSKLWSSHDHLVHFSSLLKYPVFVNGRDYNGNPKPLCVAEIKKSIYQGFTKDISSINPEAELIPLGNTVAHVITKLNRRGFIPQKVRQFEGRIVALPHPSGANAESISLLVMKKYPSRESYQESKYQDYLRRQPWKKKMGGKPLLEDRYKQARASRWEEMLFVRRAYGIQ